MADEQAPNGRHVRQPGSRRDNALVLAHFTPVGGGVFLGRLGAARALLIPKGEGAGFDLILQSGHAKPSHARKGDSRGTRGRDGRGAPPHANGHQGRTERREIGRERDVVWTKPAHD